MPLRAAAPLLLATLALVRAAALVAATDPPDREPQPALALEAELAANPVIYFVLDPVAKSLDIRSRGVVLDRVPLAEVAVVREEHILGGGEALELPLPAVLRVTFRSGVVSREIITPSSLEAYPEDGPEEDRPATKRTSAKPPESYYVTLDNGWAIAFGRALPGSSFLDRLGLAIGNGWERLLGVEITSPPTLAVALEAADAQRLHHLLRKDTPVLVLPPGDAPVR